MACDSTRSDFVAYHPFCLFVRQHHHDVTITHDDVIRYGVLGNASVQKFGLVITTATVIWPLQIWNSKNRHSLFGFNLFNISFLGNYRSFPVVHSKHRRNRSLYDVSTPGTMTYDDVITMNFDVVLWNDKFTIWKTYPPNRGEKFHTKSNSTYFLFP